MKNWDKKHNHKSPKITLFQWGKDISDLVDSFSREQKQLVLYLNDLIIFAFSIYLAFGLYSEKLFTGEFVENYIEIICLIFPTKFIVFHWMGMYRGILRYTQSTFLKTAVKSVLVAEAVLITLGLFLQFQSLPRTIQVLDAFLTLFFVVLSRSFGRWFLYKFNPSLKVARLTQFNRHFNQPIIIYGAGRAGFELSQALVNSHTYNVKAFIDDDQRLWGKSIDSIKVFNPSELDKIVLRYQIQSVLLAIPSAPNHRRQEIVTELKAKGLEVKTIPTISEIISGQFSIANIRNIEITDLLGREEVLPNPSLLSVDITGKTILVTGAGGSIGSELCRQIAQQKPQRLVLYEFNEFALYTIDIELSESFPELCCTPCLGSVTDGNFFENILLKYKVDTIYHAAAYKHVPLVETNVIQGILNNIYGTFTCARIASQCQVEKFVLISTDKAVRPTNVMGTTKRVAELILQALAKQPDQGTEFIMVRFGNVLNSNGSVVPRFKKQIAEGRPITITHPEITRYFMSIPEAARLVIQAGAMGRGGEVFLLDMGEPVKIYDLAHQMIELSGLIPEEDIKIVITGLRPGEKLYEELLIESSNARRTSHPKIFVAEEAMVPWEQLENHLEKLFLCAQAQNQDSALAILRLLVPEYNPSPKIVQEISEFSNGVIG